jgi:SAM-dependent methyltransferase
VPERRSLARRAAAAAPWRVKLAAKLVLARLPLDYGFWSGLTLFKHGPMDDPAYALDVFRRHYEHAQPRPGFSVLELGPGDTAFTAVVARAFGASRTVLVDAGPFAITDVEPYRRMAHELARQGLPAPELDDAASFEDVLERCSATYLTGGLGSLRTLDTESIDLSFSQAVLEHDRAAEMAPVLRELRRVTAPGGASSHVVDLEDHLAHALNNLRFSERVWESRLFASSGFYTNRLRRSRLLEIFDEAGFETEVVAEGRWSALPTPRARLAPAYRSAPEDDLLVRSLEVVLRPSTPRVEAT